MVASFVSGDIRLPLASAGIFEWTSDALRLANPPDVVRTSYRVIGDADVSDVDARLVEEQEGEYVIRVSYTVVTPSDNAELVILGADIVRGEP